MAAASFPQIEAIFELGDVDGDGEIDMGEFVGKQGIYILHISWNMQYCQIVDVFSWNLGFEEYIH